MFSIALMKVTQGSMVGLGDRYGEDTLKPVEAPAKLKRRNAMLESSLLERLIRVIEKHAKEMAEDLRQRLARDHRTSSFQVLDHCCPVNYAINSIGYRCRLAPRCNYGIEI